MLISLLIWLLAVTVALTLHEAAHAFISDRLGDPTARVSGRLSLNPLNHYDPIGTTMLLVTAIFTGFPIGWAKPVPFDPYNLKNPKRDSLLIALGGPAVNLILAVILSILLHYLLMEISLINVLIVRVITINVWLAIFNLLPIYPLDGSKVLYGLLPTGLAEDYSAVMSRYGTMILLFLIIPFGGSSALTTLISPLINFLLHLLLP